MTLEKIIRTNILEIVAAYRKATGKSLSQVSKKFYGRSEFFADFRTGRQSISLRRLSVMVEKFRKEWPLGADWPFVRIVYMGRRERE
jgi:hypothetical protein